MASVKKAHNSLNLEGLKFGRYTVLNKSSTSKHQKTYWDCLCDCGNRRSVCGSALKRGISKSCGCYKGSLISERNSKHGMTKTRVYRIWQAMLSRCRYKNKNYKDRGIDVCERWKSSFENFLLDMGEPPHDHSIERIDNDGDYEPSNCKWADRKTQNRNKRNSRKLTLHGETKNLKDWANDLGIDQASLRERLDKWTIEKSLTTPKGGY